VLAAQTMGADLAYIGTRFIATQEAMAAAAHKDMILKTRATDVFLTASIDGAPANWLVPSLVAAGIDLDVLRTTLPPSELASAVRGSLKSITPNLPRNDFRTLQQLVDKSVSPRRFVVMLLGGFALFALILASLGIYGVISYSVNQRTQEIGIRMALGASAGDLQARIIMQTLALAAIGMLLGGAASWALARALSGLLFGVTPGDPVTFLAMLVILTAVAALAGYLPARRASRIDPMVALRAN